MVETKIELRDNSEVDPAKLLNINIGVLGHIDSGKTSLCKAMSTIASTAGFDKNPQSKERGITLDLGFSAFIIDVPEWLRSKEPEKLQGVNHIQFTLVDCPGHASLMKTVIGGASIIDLMILVVDCQKLIQTQTAECIVLGEILMDKLVVAFNKIDILEKEPEKLALQLKKLKMQIGRTKFGENATVVPVNAVPASDSEEDKRKCKETVMAFIDAILK
jgi:selenocysteine-specific elongation factor